MMFIFSSWKHLYRHARQNTNNRLWIRTEGWEGEGYHLYRLDKRIYCSRSVLPENEARGQTHAISLNWEMRCICMWSMSTVPTRQTTHSKDTLFQISR